MIVLKLILLKAPLKMVIILKNSLKEATRSCLYLEG